MSFSLRVSVHASIIDKQVYSELSHAKVRSVSGLIKCCIEYTAILRHNRAIQAKW